jgi:hypothetical protein
LAGPIRDDDTLDRPRLFVAIDAMADCPDGRLMRTI